MLAAETALLSHSDTDGFNTRVCWKCANLGFSVVGEDQEFLDQVGDAFGQWRSHKSSDAVLSWSVSRDPSNFVTVTTKGEILSSRSRVELTLCDLETLSVNACLETPEAPPSLHASLVMLSDGTAVSFLGRCGAGKSTTALWLWHHRNMPLVCDDVLLMDERPGWIHAVPRRVSVRNASRQILGDECWERILDSPRLLTTTEGYLFAPPECHDFADAIRLRAVFLLDRFQGTAARGVALRVPPTEALFSISPHSSARNRGRAPALRAAAAIADSVPVFELGRAEPERMADAIDAALGSCHLTS